MNLILRKKNKEDLHRNMISKSAKQIDMIPLFTSRYNINLNYIEKKLSLKKSQSVVHQFKKLLK